MNIKDEDDELREVKRECQILENFLKTDNKSVNNNTYLYNGKIYNI